MRTELQALARRVRHEDPQGWQAVEALVAELPEIARRGDARGDLDADLWDRVPAGVFNRINMPPAYGGAALTATALRRAMVFEHVGRVCPAVPIGLPGPGLSTPPVDALGTPAQKQAYFDAFIASPGPRWGAFAITEPQGGSDATAMRTVARRSPDGDYVLDGQKCFISSGARADAVVVFATLDPAKGRFGVRAFWVDKGTPGFHVDRCEDMLGLRASQLAALSFTGCRVPAERMLGHTGARGPLIDAFAGAQSAWDYMRPALAAGINGACLGLLEHAGDLLAQGEAGTDPRRLAAIRAGLDEFGARVEAARLLALRAAWRFDRGERISPDASMAKAHSSTLAMALALRLAAWFPERAARRGERIERFCRDAKGFDILEGTGDMQRLMLARAAEARTAH
ncbi:MAG: acyl-CoA dehydrogenase family protein [Piscinibacter sp.]|uniref:acyl-CoA dehydrogenase family protein n=1 Tax=Piscinibacter TaxID=1114981 RepID=UPI000FDD1C14|nr:MULTISPECIES: acyl-CoA dehydrogenase family protein [Piscinibacter]MCW5667460.1 acyl-CoA dehydrogenase family protein [Piscinibacter sp.]